jgi:hypothetical protein
MIQSVSVSCLLLQFIKTNLRKIQTVVCAIPVVIYLKLYLPGTILFFRLLNPYLRARTVLSYLRISVADPDSGSGDFL